MTAEAPAGKEQAGAPRGRERQQAGRGARRAAARRGERGPAAPPGRRAAAPGPQGREGSQAPRAKTPSQAPRADARAEVHSERPAPRKDPVPPQRATPTGRRRSSHSSLRAARVSTAPSAPQVEDEACEIDESLCMQILAL